jgi:hypothetical protein
MTDPESRLRGIVGKSGMVSSVYGGFEIIVLEPSNFRWYDVLTTLLDIGHEVWVTKKNGHLRIFSKFLTT